MPIKIHPTVIVLHQWTWRSKPLTDKNLDGLKYTTPESKGKTEIPLSLITKYIGSLQPMRKLYFIINSDVRLNRPKSASRNNSMTLTNQTTYYFLRTKQACYANQWISENNNRIITGFGKWLIKQMKCHISWTWNMWFIRTPFRWQSMIVRTEWNERKWGNSFGGKDRE